MNPTDTLPDPEEPDEHEVENLPAEPCCDNHPVGEHPDGVDIKGWCKDLVKGVGGLNDLYKYEMGGTRPNTVNAVEFAVRALANPRCKGSRQVLDAIITRRTSKAPTGAEAVRVATEVMETFGGFPPPNIKTLCEFILAQATIAEGP